MSGDRGYRSPYAAPDHARAQFIEALRRAAVAEAERDEARHELIVLRAGIRKPRRPQKWQLP